MPRELVREARRERRKRTENMDLRWIDQHGCFPFPGKKEEFARIVGQSDYADPNAAITPSRSRHIHPLVGIIRRSA